MFLRKTDFITTAGYSWIQPCPIIWAVVLIDLPVRNFFLLSKKETIKQQYKL